MLGVLPDRRQPAEFEILCYAEVVREILRERLSQSRTPYASRALAPELAYGRHAGPSSRDAREAAVLVLFYPGHDDSWQLLMTIRAAAMQIHPGQVCFPGGRLEGTETPEEGALREFEEELGSLPIGLEFVGRLSPLFVFGSNFLVTPCVAVAQDLAPIKPNPHEVAAVLSFPWQVLAAAETRQQIVIERRGLRFTAPCYRVQEYSIWGATALMLEELLQILQR